MERNSRKLIRMLEQDGWRHVRTKGSHWIFEHPKSSVPAIVPHPKKDVPIGTVNTIYRTAGWK